MQSAKEKPKSKAVGCFLEHEGRFLILQRRPEEHQGEKWGLPLIPPEKLEFLQEIVFEFLKKQLTFSPIA